MEELLKKFQSYLEKRISPKLSSRLEDYLQTFKVNKNPDFDEIEHDVKLIVSNYFNNCNQTDFLNIANNLYESYVEEDDNNLISSVKFIIRLYSKFEDLSIKRFFFRWRINSKSLSIKKNITNINSMDNSFNNEDMLEKHYKQNTNSDIFDRLYKEASKKNDEKLLNNELKKLSELEECTFKPNVNKSNNYLK